jgi:TRAP transporter TAXI family solute receptor
MNIGRNFIMGFTRWQIFKALTAVVVIGSAVWLALIYFIPTLPSKVVMATAFKGASFEYYGRQYQEIFARSHVQLELRETAGAVENLKLLQDRNAGVQIAFVTGGLSDAKHAPGVLSLGTVYDQPFWIFHSANWQIDQLAQLKGKRIAVGPVGSATRYMAEQVLGKGGVNYETATLLPFAGSAAEKALKDGEVEAVWIIGVPEATAVQSFLRDPNVRPMNFPMADAFTRVFPDLARMTLPQGTVDIERVIPSSDVQLIGTKAKVLIRSDLHPEIVQLLLRTMKEVHGGSDLFHRSGEYPNGSDSEYPVAATAIEFYKNGPSFMQRHLPLWLSVHVQRAIAVLLTGAAIGLPLLHFVPQAYNWMTRRRLFYWYAELRALEASFGTATSHKHLIQQLAEIERIEDSLSKIHFPLTFADQVYTLRSHINIVRQKIASRLRYTGQVAA